MENAYYFEDNGTGHLGIYDPYDDFVVSVEEEDAAQALVSHLNNPGTFTSLQTSDDRFNILAQDGALVITVDTEEEADGLLSHLNR